MTRVALEDVKAHGNLPVPLHLRNAPTGLMRTLGYGRDYKYSHDYTEHFVEQQYLPDQLKGRRYYEPSDQGHEAQVKERQAKRRKANPA